MKRPRFFRHRVEHLGLLAFERLARSLTPGGARSISRIIGDLLYDRIRLRRSVALENLRVSFPLLDEAERERIARSCYRNFASTAVEFVRLPTPRGRQLTRETEIVGREHLDAAVASGRGAILLTGHFGNWEWVGAALPAQGFKTRVVVGEQKNRSVDAYINRLRRSMGLGVLSADRDVRGMIAALREGAFLAIVADQDAGRDGLPVPFFGRIASTAVGPAHLARRLQVPILQGFSVRGPDGRIRLEILAPLWVPADGDESDEIERATRAWSARLEEYVRRYPEQWFWMHRRWKTRPGDIRRLQEEGIE